MDILSMKLIKVSYQYIWLWCVAIEPTNKQIVQSDISFERTMLIVAEHFISSLIYKYGKHLVSTEMVAVLGIHLNLASFWNSNIIFILLIREKYLYRKDYTIYQIQDGKLWWLFSVHQKKKEMQT